MASSSTFSFVTDTATLAIFDPTRLAHRLADDADWWCVPVEELSEINRGNLLSVSTGSDGRYEVELCLGRAESAAPSREIQALVGCESGRLFLGAGEEIPSEGLMPEAIRGGVIHPAAPGTYRVVVSRPGARSLRVCLEPVALPARNEFEVSPRLAER